MTDQIIASPPEGLAEALGSWAELAKWARARNIDEVECVAVDFAGTGRGKVMPADKFFSRSEVRIPASIFMSTIAGQYPEYAFSDYDLDVDYRLLADIDTTRAVPWTSTPSLQIIHDVVDRDGRSIDFMPRAILKRVMLAYAELGLKPIIAPEIEFYITKPNTDPDYPLEPPIGRSGRASVPAQAYSISGVDEHEKLVELIYDFAEAQNLEIDTLNQEEGAAQFEINLLHGDPLALADQVFMFKRTIREAAYRCGLYATFMAKPMEGQPGSAMHVHQSVIDLATGQNIFSRPDGGASPRFGHFVGGLQGYFFAAMALVAPYANSYRRLVPDQSAPINLDWAEDNRTCGLRIPQAATEDRRVENRVIGSDANPYLAFAATLACGLLGMIEEKSPRAPVSGDAWEHPHELPRSLLEATEALAGCEPLRNLLGHRFCDLFCTIKRLEHEEFMRVISPWEREHLLLRV